MHGSTKLSSHIKVIVHKMVSSSTPANENMKTATLLFMTTSNINSVGIMDDKTYIELIKIIVSK